MKIPNTVMVLAIAVLAALPEQASASCERSKRISHRDAECLEASWHNPHGVDVLMEWSSYRVRNSCASLGTVVAKVDVKSAKDIIERLRDSAERYGESRMRIRWIYCCADLSDLCSP